MNWVLRLLIRSLPRRFRERHGRDLLELHQDLTETARPFRRIRFRVQVAVDLVLTGLLARVDAFREWMRRRHSCRHSGPAESTGRLERPAARGPASGLWLDFRYALRSLRKRPTFSSAVVLTLGLGIGATTAVFGVVEGVLLRPLPFERPSELVTVWKTFPEWLTNDQIASMWDKGHLAYPDYERWREHQTMFAEVGLYGDVGMTLTGRGSPERLFVGLASASLLRVLGISPARGRFFVRAEEGPGGAQVAVLSHAFWRERFGGDPRVLGEAITVNGRAFTVVGVLPETFHLRSLGMYGESGERPFWIPVGADGASLDAGNHAFEAVARLKPGVSLSQAAGETDALVGSDGHPADHGARLVLRKDAEAVGIRGPLVLLFAASLVLLLLASGNVSLLFMGEVGGRRHEVATRVALGAGRGRIIRWLLAESALLCTVATVFGILLATAGTRAMVSLASTLPHLERLSVNRVALAFAAIIGIVTSVVFGVVPFLDQFRSGPHDVLHGKRHATNRGASTVQRLVVSLQVALTVVLLVSGGLLARSLDRLLAVDPGFRKDNVVEIRTEMPLHDGSR